VKIKVVFHAGIVMGQEDAVKRRNLPLSPITVLLYKL
jgi:hypothetical protein